MQSSSEITFHPLDLSEHGKTTAGLSLYRIVKADSRIDKFSQEGRLYELPRYEACGSKWVLEKWLAPEKLIGMTPEQYEEFLKSQLFGSAQMPYPHDGDYELVYPFEGAVDPEKARTICQMINFDQNNFTDTDRTMAVHESLEQKRLDVADAKTKIIEAALSRSK